MEHIEECINSLNSKDPKTREYSHFELVNVIGRQAVPALIATLKSNRSPKDHFGRVWRTIIDIGGPEVEEFFINMLRDKENYYRTDAIAALGEMSAKRAVPLLVGSMQEKDPKIRENSILALGYIADPSAVPYLRSALKDSDPESLEKTIFSLFSIGDAGSVILIRELLSHRLAKIRAVALMAMGHMGSKCDLKVLYRMVECDRSGIIRNMVSTVISAIESMEKVPRKAKVVIVPEITSRSAFDPHNEVFVRGGIEDVGHILRVHAKFEEAYNTDFGWVGQEYVEIV